MECIGSTTFKKLNPRKGYLAPYVQLPWGYDESLIGKEIDIYKIDTGFIIQFKQDSPIQKVYDVKPTQKRDYESAAMPLSHGGAIPHNIALCRNKPNEGDGGNAISRDVPFWLNDCAQRWEKTLMHCRNPTGKIHNLMGKKIIGLPMQDAYRQLIVSICDEVLPNMVRLIESQKVGGMFDHDYFVKLVEKKVAQANKAVKMLPAEEQAAYREKINHAYAINIDQLRHGVDPHGPIRPGMRICDADNTHI